MTIQNGRWSSIQLTKNARDELKARLLPNETYEEMFVRIGVLRNPNPPATS